MSSLGRYPFLSVLLQSLYGVGMIFSTSRHIPLAVGEQYFHTGLATFTAESQSYLRIVVVMCSVRCALYSKEEGPSFFTLHRANLFHGLGGVYTGGGDGRERRYSHSRFKEQPCGGII